MPQTLVNSTPLTRIMTNKLSTLGNVSLGVLFVVSLFALCHRITIYKSHKRLFESNDCKPLPKYPHVRFVFGLDYVWHTIRAVKSQTFLSETRLLFKELGPCFSTHILATRAIHTIEPQDIKIILATSFQDYGISKRRKRAFRPYVGKSIFTADGSQWKHSRAFLQPSFFKRRLDVAIFHSHGENLLQAIPRDHSTFDLEILFHKLTADVITELMYGESINSLSQPNAIPMSLMEAFSAAQIGCENRGRWGVLQYLILQPKASRSVKMVHEYIEHHVDRVINCRESLGDGKSVTENLNSKGQNDTLLHKFAEITSDRQVLRDELLSIFVAGRDTSASILCNLFFVLARRPDIWQKLREEVETLRDEIPTIEQLDQLAFLKSCINEGRVRGSSHLPPKI